MLIFNENNNVVWKNYKESMIENTKKVALKASYGVDKSSGATCTGNSTG